MPSAMAIRAVSRRCFVLVSLLGLLALARPDHSRAAIAYFGVNSAEAVSFGAATQTQFYSDLAAMGGTPDERLRSRSGTSPTTRPTGAPRPTPAAGRGS
jgi:hypothetical protein